MLRPLARSSFCILEIPARALFHLSALLRLTEVMNKSTQGGVTQKNTCHAAETRTRRKI